MPELKYKRLNPDRKDLFIRGIGFNPCYPFKYGNALDNAGIHVHDVTNWGHDATADRTFYTYYTAGKITNIDTNTDITAKGDSGWQITWPKHEWEFRLDSDYGDDEAWTPIGRGIDADSAGSRHDISGKPQSVGVIQYPAAPAPHQCFLGAARRSERQFVSWDDGHIKFVSASPPSNQNPLGTRNWTWSTKGYSLTVGVQEQEDMYGIAFTLQNPLDRYFYDRPYEQVTAWDGFGWVKALERI